MKKEKISRDRDQLIDRSIISSLRSMRETISRFKIIRSHDLITIAYIFIHKNVGTLQ